MIRFALVLALLAAPASAQSYRTYETQSGSVTYGSDGSVAVRDLDELSVDRGVRVGAIRHASLSDGNSGNVAPQSHLVYIYLDISHFLAWEAAEINANSNVRDNNGMDDT